MRERPWSVSARALAVPLALALASCVTPAAQKQLGDDEAKKVEHEMGLVRDPALQSYLRAVGAKLVAVSGRPDSPWQFEIVDQPEPNAFALPGGHVYVSRGLLCLVNSEDELAGVIGHEIAHVTADHSAKRTGAALATAPVRLATGLAGFALGIVSPELGGLLAGTGDALAEGLVLAPFSREQEHEADELGQELAARAGYDPRGLPQFLHTLDRDLALHPGAQPKLHFLDHHPLTPDRVARTEERAQALIQAASSPVASGRDAVLARLEGIVVGEDPAQGVFVKSRFLHPELDLAITFPADWETRNTTDAAGAISPARDGLVFVRLAAQGSTLEDVLDKASKDQPDVRFERFAVNGLAAARTRFAGNDAVAEVTLIEHGRNVYAVVGESAEPVARKYVPLFRASAGSFHALRNSERRAILESRLRARKARPGETPAEIAARTGSTWNAERIAVANEVAVDVRFDAGRTVKLALPQSYTPRGP